MDDFCNEALKFYSKRYGEKYLVPFVIIFILQIILLILLIIIEYCCRKKNNKKKLSFKSILTFGLSSINDDEDARIEGGKDSKVKVAKSEEDLGRNNISNMTISIKPKKTRKK